MSNPIASPALKFWTAIDHEDVPQFIRIEWGSKTAYGRICLVDSVSINWHGGARVPGRINREACDLVFGGFPEGHETEEKMEAACLASLCQHCGEAIDGYEPTASDAKAASAEASCETCHMAAVRVAKREKAQAAHEAAEEMRGVAWREA